MLYIKLTKMFHFIMVWQAFKIERAPFVETFCGCEVVLVAVSVVVDVVFMATAGVVVDVVIVDVVEVVVVVG